MSAVWYLFIWPLRSLYFPLASSHKITLHDVLHHIQNVLQNSVNAFLGFTYSRIFESLPRRICVGFFVRVTGGKIDSWNWYRNQIWNWLCSIKCRFLELESTSFSGFPPSPPENQFQGTELISHKESIQWSRCIGSLKVQDSKTGTGEGGGGIPNYWR